MFYILNTITNQPYSRDGETVVYETGALAADAAENATGRLGQKHQVRRVEIDNALWHARETDRFNNGFYQRPSLFSDHGLAPIYEHFCHVSKNDPTRIAYTQDAIKGAADIQTPIRVGAYLTRYYSDLSPENIARIVADWTQKQAPLELQFATSANDIETVYRNGPRSCMSYAPSNYESSIHPVRVYGDSDLSLAYIEPRDGEISARALVWQERKIYGRIYGDEVRLKTLLESAGFIRGSFIGASIRRLVCDKHDEFIAPYIDNDPHLQKRVKNGENVFTIVSYNDPSGVDHVAQCTHGLVRDVCTATCDHCGDGCDEDTTYMVYVNRYDMETWCEHCADHGSFFCQGNDERYTDDLGVDCDGHTYSRYYVENNASYCDRTEQHTFQDMCEVTVPTRSGNIKIETWCQSAIDDHAFPCRITGDYYDNRLITSDPWADEPRALCVSPNDVPETYKGSYQYHSYDRDQGRLFLFNIHRAA